MRYVTVVNRTNETLNGTWDGRHYDIAPGKHQFPEIQAIKFREQNPVMGTEDPRTGRMTYKIGIVEQGDPIETLGSFKEGIERWDRSKLIGALPTQEVAGDNGLYQLGRTAGSTALPSNVAFVDPSR